MHTPKLIHAAAIGSVVALTTILGGASAGAGANYAKSNGLIPLTAYPGSTVTGDLSVKLAVDCLTGAMKLKVKFVDATASYGLSNNAGLMPGTYTITGRASGKSPAGTVDCADDLTGTVPTKLKGPETRDVHGCFVVIKWTSQGILDIPSSSATC